MNQYRRDVLMPVQAKSDTHAGLWLDKYLKDDNKGGDDNRKSSKGELVDEVTKIKTPNIYPRFFERWKQALLDCGAECREAKTLGRLAVNLGADGVLETSIALHHTYGLPYIPGSALKGLAAHYVLLYQDKNTWGRESDAFKTLFGSTTSAGYVTFYDALYVPGSGHQGQALWPDIITVHHPDYYQGKDSPPADWDSPTPIPFLTATGKFLIALSGPDKWVETAFDILALALEREGVGAKTSSGYGRMKFTDGGGNVPHSDEPYAIRKKRLLGETPLPGYYRGTLASITDRYGQINPAKGGAQVFAHTNQIKAGGTVLHVGQVVEYKFGSTA